MKSFLHIPVDADDERQLRGVYAVLASPAALAAALAALEGGSSGNIAAPVAERASPVMSKSSATVETQASGAPASDGTGAIATNDASPSDSSEVDAHGWPWSADMHASTKGQTNDGLWRMKVGVKRPDPKPGFPKPDGTGTSENTAPAASTEAASAPVTDVEEDEFAAFTKASQEVASTDAPARSWADADLSALCAQAATKLGDADPVRAIIASYVPEGETPHSRNVPADQREAFAAEIEAKAGITYAG